MPCQGGHWWILCTNTQQYDPLVWEVTKSLVLVVVDHCLQPEKHVTHLDVLTLATYGKIVSINRDLLRLFLPMHISLFATPASDNQAQPLSKRIGGRRLGHFKRRELLTVNSRTAKF